MMLLLGILGMLQAIALPGMLFLYAVCPIKQASLRAGVVFGLSLLANYVLVWLLVVTSLYTRQIMLAICFVEMIGISVLMYKQRGQRQPGGAAVHPVGSSVPIKHWGSLTARFFVVLLFVYTMVLMLSQVGNIFTSWDAVCSWNRWAVSWASDKLPSTTYHYPQLVPIFISIPYVFMKNSYIQFFSYIICLCFLPLSMCLCMSLQRWRDFVFPALFLAVGVLVWFFQRGMANLGYADFPVLYFCLLSMVSLLQWGRAGGDARDDLLALSLMFAAGAAVTKQAGVYWFLLIPFAIWENARFRWSRREIGKVCGIFVLLLALVAAWYIFVEVLITRSRELSEISTVTMAIHKGRSFYERWILTLERWPAVWVLWVTALSGIAVRRMRIFALTGLSYTICWSLFFSYDLRNLAIGIPFLLWSSGVGIALCSRLFYGYLERNTKFLIKNSYLDSKVSCRETYQRIGYYLHQSALFLRNKKKRLLVSALVTGLGLAVICVTYSSYINSFIIEFQNKKSMEFGNKELNILLSKTMRERKLPLISIYPPAYSNPDIGYSSMMYAYGTKVESFLKNPHVKKPCYMLFADASRVQELQDLSRDRPLHKLGEAGGYVLYLAE